jgi:hypothetical protein
LVLSPDLEPGRYAFRLRPAPGQGTLCLGRFVLRPWPSSSLGTTEVRIDHPLKVEFASGVRLMGYDLPEKALAPGETLVVTLYWQAREPVESRYKVFTHLLGEVYNAKAGSFLWGQQDNEPVNGTRPTVTWRAGEVILDRYAIPVEPDAPPGTYHIEIGLYSPATLERVPVLDDRGQPTADHLVLTQVEIR